MDLPNINPFVPDDVELFYDSTQLKTLHSQTYRGHTGTIRTCGTCFDLAFCSLACMAGTARRRGRSRERFIEDQRRRGFGNDSNPFPQNLLTLYVLRGVEMYLPQNERSSKPAVAARGGKFTDALRDAHERGELTSAVEVAQLLLEHVIRVVQADGEPRTEAGHVLPFGYIAHRVRIAVTDEFGGTVASELLGDPGELAGEWGVRSAERTWQEIVGACEGTPAERELDKHVFHYSAHLSRAFLSAGSSAARDHGDSANVGTIPSAVEPAANAAVEPHAEHDPTDDLHDDLHDSSVSPDYCDAVHEWALEAANAVRTHAAPLDALPSAVQHLLDSALDMLDGQPESESEAEEQQRRKSVRDLHAQVARQAARSIIWDDVLELATKNVQVGGRLAFDNLDLVVEMVYELLREKGYPFEKEERGWRDPEVRRVALRGWARRIVRQAIRPS